MNSAGSDDVNTFSFLATAPIMTRSCGIGDKLFVGTAVPHSVQAVVMNYAGSLTLALIIGTFGLTTGLPSDYDIPLDLSKLIRFEPNTPIPPFPDFDIKTIPDLSGLGRLPDPCEENIPDFLSCPVEDIRAAVQHKDETFGTAVTCNCNRDKRVVVSMSCDRKDAKWKYISETTIKFNLVFCIVLHRIRNQKILRVINIQMPRATPMNSTSPPPYQQIA
ncbi:hypothetical protein B566_EDAN013309 [Ephemera danica]|nr:hypothetical protein B566_EDAN013309 [Ephemera danica]